MTGPDTFVLARRFFDAGAGEAAWPDEEGQRSERAPGVRGAGRAWRRIQGSLRWRGMGLPACAYLMPGPRSYTRQDLIEFHLLGSNAVLQGLLSDLHQAGARLAGPGEFTRRALLNGRLSLAQAEAVGALIQATRADEARAWVSHAARLGQTAPGQLRDGIQALLAHLELGLDFSLEDVTLLPREELARRLKELAWQTASALEAEGEAPSELAWGGPPRVVLVGPTGAGKSTLLNALVGRDVALISAAGHTTRDPVEIVYEVEPGVPVRFIDTAGVDTPDRSPPLARCAMGLTARAARAADLLLVVVERTVEAVRQVSGLTQLLSTSRPAVVALVWNKSDLVRPPLGTEQEDEARRATACLAGDEPAVEFHVAAKHGEGLGPLVSFLQVRSRALLPE